MTPVEWRWSEKDFGFRFQGGEGKTKAEHYQAREPGAFYVVPPKDRKLHKSRLEELNALSPPPTSPRLVPNPWRNYGREWDWITTEDGVLLNFAGCLDHGEINRREDEGVARAMDLVAGLLGRAEPVKLTPGLIRQIHLELLGKIYPIAGAWRTVSLHKGDGPTRWPLPPGGIDLLVSIFDRDVLSRSPLVSGDDEAVFRYVSEVMGELLAIHPFREGNGRTAFIVGNLLLMQNNLLPLDVYDRRKDELRYYGACDEARVHRNYEPLAALLSEWEAAAQVRWQVTHGD